MCSIKLMMTLIEQARKKMEGRDPVSRAARIELSSGDRTIYMMRDNSRDITLVQGARCRDHWHLLVMATGGNERLAIKMGKKCKMKCTHETSLGTMAEVTDDLARVPRARRTKGDNPESPSERLRSRSKRSQAFS